MLLFMKIRGESRNYFKFKIVLLFNARFKDAKRKELAYKPGSV